LYFFRSATGRWERKDIVNIYKYDSNKVYYAASNRFEIDKKSVSVFRGDGFISRIYKKSTFKKWDLPLNQLQALMHLIWNRGFSQ
jgi:hypothetical protein